MEDLLKEILKKIDNLEVRISQIEEDLYVVPEEDETDVVGLEGDMDSIPKAVAILNSVEKISIRQMQQFLNCGHTKAVRVMKQLHDLGLVNLEEESEIFTVNKSEVVDYIQQNKEDTRWN